MTAKRPKQTLADYMAIAVSPVLIMALVGSLVFFLLEVLYVGQYQGRLQWILFFFVFGAVLIARISMQSDIAARAGVYGLLLGGLVWLALLLYVDYHDSGPMASLGWAINAVLIAIIWWCAHRLTWDCTLIDDSVDASGAGLLEAAGLEKPPGTATAEPEPEPPGGKKKRQEPHPLLAWWDRYQRFREERLKRPHTPGVWVVYFSLAALPLFGLGQALIPETEPERRRYTFFLLVIYVSSGLGLLLTTSFLGLRRYLRQRGLKMPAALAGTWLTVGGLMIAALLLVGAFLPRPDNDTRWLEWAGVKSGERKASRFDLKGDSPGKGKGRRVAKGSRSGGQGDGEKSNEAGGKDNRQTQDANAQGKRDAEGGGNKGQGKEAGKGGAGKGNAQGEGRDPGDKDPDKDDEDGSRGPNRDSDSSSESSRNFSPPETSTPRTLSEILENASPVVKWVLYIILGLAGGYVIFRVVWAWLRYLSHFTLWVRTLIATLQAWWQTLLGWLYGRPAEESLAEEAEKVRAPRPFSAFRNPFWDGNAERRSRAELVRYSFEALQAWAAERDLGRQPGETPLEFAQRLGLEFAALESDGRRLVSLYVRAAYARGSLPASCLDIVRQFWDRLTDVTERPLSAGAADAGPGDTMTA